MSERPPGGAEAPWPEFGAPRRAHIVSHTHWDREWYRTFEEFRLSLVDVVGQVLDRLERGGEFRHFVLDGQTLVLEDHLEIRPEDEPRIRRLVSEGALAVGPWYILPDEFLVSGESTVRNLLIGDRVARRFGGAQRVGYMPDSFGHLAQMPQLLRRAGLDSFVYTRGNGDEIDALGHEYIWSAPDGSEVLAINQCGGYCNAGGLGYEEIWHAHTRRAVETERAVEQVRELFSKMRRLSRSDVVLLNNGCDHFPPQRDFERVLVALREAFPETEFVHSSLEAYVDEVRSAGFAKSRYEGELLGGRLHHILSGVWSARMPLKQRNERCETLLETVVEPLAAYGHFGLGLEYPFGAIDDAWRRLMRNHPHDSICGCSTDAVHRDMLTRFDGVERTGEEIVRRTMEAFTPTFAERAAGDRSTVIAVANPLPECRTDVVDRMVVLQPFGIDPDDLRLFDEAGTPVPFVELDRVYVERFWGIDYRKQLDARAQSEQFETYRTRFADRFVRDASQRETSDCFLTIRFLACDLPAVGHAHYFLREDPGASAPPPAEGSVRIVGDRIVSESLEVRLHPDGSFDLSDRRTGEQWHGLNVFEDVEDVGDEYDYSACERSKTVSAKGVAGRVRVLDDSPLAGRLRAEFDLALPCGILPDRRSRDPALVDCPVRVDVALRQNCPWVEVEVSFDNRAKDHRLRTLFPSGIRSSEIVSDGQFFVRPRPIRQPDGADWVQPPPGTVPQQEFSLVQVGARGLAVFERGLPEIQAVAVENGPVTLALTLLRSVEWLSRDDFPTRRHSNAGPTIHTPDAQCPGEQRFHYAVAPFAGDWLREDIKGASRRYRVPLPSIQGVGDGRIPGGGGLLSKSTHLTSISAVKRHETRDSLVVRLYNLASRDVGERLTFGRAVDAAWTNDLLEERVAPLDVQDGRHVELDIGAHEIVTLEIEFAADAIHRPDRESR